MAIRTTLALCARSRLLYLRDAHTRHCDKLRTARCSSRREQPHRILPPKTATENGLCSGTSMRGACWGPTRQADAGLPHGNTQALSEDPVRDHVKKTSHADEPSNLALKRAERGNIKSFYQASDLTGCALRELGRGERRWRKMLHGRGGCLSYHRQTQTQVEKGGSRGTTNVRC